MKRLAILLLVLSPFAANAATPTLRIQMPRVVNAKVYNFADGAPGWSLGGFTHLLPHTGFLGATEVLSLEIADDVGSIATHGLFTPAYGRSYSVSAWINGDGATEPQPLFFFIQGLAFYASSDPILPSQVAPGWQRINLGVFVGTLDPDTYIIGAGTQAIVGPVETGRWLIGQIEFREIEFATEPSEFGSN